ncbi:MAG TPA: hypothetical protein VIY90_14610 [Steroidobacteraceae bacterium]
MAPRKKKSSPVVKGLAEIRSRASWQIENLKKTIAKTEQELAMRRQELSALVTRAAGQRRQLKTATLDLSACDLALREELPNLDPTRIPAIKPRKVWQTKSGKTRKVLREILKACAPESLSVAQLAREVERILAIQFPTPQERYRWVKHSLHRALRHVRRAGSIEPLPAPRNGLLPVQRWRWKSAGSSSLAHLAAKATAAGLSVKRVASSRGRRRAA